MFTLKSNLKITHFVLLMSFLNFLFFHLPFFTFVFNNIDCKSFNGITIVISLVILMLVLNALAVLPNLWFSKLLQRYFCINN